MPNTRRLYEQAQRSPNNLSFSELCALAEGVGFVFKRQRGDHKIYKHPGIRSIESLINLQNRNGQAKPYQVKQLLSLIYKYDLIEREDERA